MINFRSDLVFSMGRLMSRFAPECQKSNYTTVGTLKEWQNKKPQY